MNFGNWIALAGIAFMPSCSTSKTNTAQDRIAFIPEESFQNLNPEQTISRDQAISDVENLIKVLETGYAGFLPEAKIPKNHLVKKLEALPSNLPEKINPEIFAKYIDNAFFTFPDSHLAVRSFRDDSSRDRKTKEKLASVGSNIGEGRTEKHCYYIEDRVIEKLDASIIAIPTRFLPPTDPCWEGFDAQIKSRIKKDLIVIDLRGNTGGNDSKGFDLAAMLAGKEIETPFEFTKQVWLKTPTALDLHLNTQKWIVAYAPTQGWPVDGYRDTLKKTELETQKRFKNGDFKPEISDLPEDFKVKTNPKRKIAVLVDAKCGSSCESTLEALMTIPESRVVGENTRGCRHFTNVGTYLLPNSRLNIQIPTKYNVYKSFLESIGHTPHLNCEGHDALEYLVKNLGKLK